MRILVCGDRNWNLISPIRRELQAIAKELAYSSIVVLHGACRGADTIAGEVAEELGLQVQGYPADWEKHGRAAGPIRNAQMLREGKPDLVLAFHTNMARSKGTKNMIEQANRAGIPVYLFAK